MVEAKLKLKNYVGIDIENPNRKADSICSIALIEVDHGKIKKESSMLINPEDKFDEINMRINGITPNMVKGAITFDKFWNDNKHIIENNIIVGHGIKYDLSVIFKTLKKYNITLPTLKIVCTQKLARKYLNINNYTLSQVCNYLNINLENHHNALCDTKASLKIFEYINNKYGIDKNDIEEYNYFERESHSTVGHINYSDTTKELQTLKEIVESIMKDNRIEPAEIQNLNSWLDCNKDLKGNYPFDRIYNVVKNVLQDNIITNDEYNDFIQIFNEFINPIQEQKSNGNIVIENMIFCLSGEFNFGSKEDIEEKIINKGGRCSKSVSSKTNYLIVGGAGSNAWKFGNYGGKVQKAMELKGKGKKIEIIEEEELINALNK